MRSSAGARAITGVFGFTALAQTSGSTATQDNSMHCMEGMAMPGCPQTNKNQQNAPGMQHHQHSTSSKPPQNAQPQQPQRQNDMDNMPGMQHMQHDMSGMQMGTPQQTKSPDTQ